MDATYVRSSFAGGQWSKRALGRYHDPKYQTALATCLNFLVTETEDLVRRPGTQYAGPTKGGMPGRVLKLDFEELTVAYTIEITDGNMCFRGGSNFATTNDATAVVAISTAKPAVMQLGAAVTWLSGNRGYFSGLGANAPTLQNRVFNLTKIDSTHFSLTDSITGAAIDGSTLGAIGNGALFNRILDIGPAIPYFGSGWQNLRLVQTEDVAVLLSPGIVPTGLIVVTPPTFSTSASFNFVALNMMDGPYMDPLTNGAQLTPTATNGIITLTLSFAAWSSTKSYGFGDFVTSGGNNYTSLADQNVNHSPATSPTWWQATNANNAINGGKGFVQSDVGRMIRLYSEPAPWNSATSYVAGNQVSYNPSGASGQTTYWSAAAASTNVTPGTDTTKWSLLEQGGNSSPALWSWGKITSLSNFIPGNIAGATNIGTMTGNGGVAAAFDGVLTKNASASAEANLSISNAGSGVFTLLGFLGQNYTGTAAGHYAINSVTIFPTTDGGLAQILLINGTMSGTANLTLTASLYGSNSPPGPGSPGTLLGSTVVFSQDFPAGEGSPQVFTRGLSPATIISNDNVTTYAYAQVGLTLTFNATALNNFTGEILIYAAQVEFVASGGSGSTTTGVNLEILGAPLLYTNTVTTWRLGLYSNTTGWPTCGTYDDGRLWLSGVVNNRVDACVSNGVVVDAQRVSADVNFAPTDQYANVLDSSGISATFNAPDANPIYWMSPEQQGIICGTPGGEFLVYGPSGGGMTPTNIAIRRLTRIGAANIEPQRTEHTLAVVQKFVRKIVEYFADVFSGKYSAPNLIKNAKNLSVGGIQELTYQQELSPTLWACVANALIGCTYIRRTLMTSSDPDMAAWHQHTLGSGRAVESLATGSSLGGNLDALTIVTNDQTTNVRHVGVLTDILDEGAPLSAASYLDDAITPSSTSAAAVTAQMPYGGLTLNGLWPHNGKTVTAWLGGLDCGDYVVSNGSITVSFGDGIGNNQGAGTANGLFTQAFVNTGVTANGVTMFTGTMPMRVGFTYTSQVQLARAYQPAEAGSRNGPAFGKISRAHWLMIQLEGMAGPGGLVGNWPLMMGTKFDGTLKPAYIKTPNVGNLRIDQTFSGIFRDQFASDYDLDTQPCIQVTRPYPCNVQAFGPARQTQDV